MENKSVSLFKKGSETSIQRISIAETSKRVKDSTDDEIVAVLRYIIVLLGLPERNDADQLGKNVIINFIKEYWCNMRIDEIRLAFDMAVSRKFDVKLDLYDRPFNVEYISSVITAYRNHKKRITSKSELELVALPQVKSTNKDYYNGLIQYVQENKKIPLMWNWDQVFSYLEESALIKDTIEEKKAFANKIKTIIFEEKIIANQEGDVRAFTLAKDCLEGTGFKNRCRKERVIEYLKTYYAI